MSLLRPMNSTPLTWRLTDGLSDRQIKKALADVVAEAKLVDHAVHDSDEPTFILVAIGNNVVITVGMDSDAEAMFAAYMEVRKDPRKMTVIGLDLQAQPNH